jgi:hypothetical protein
MEQPEVAEQMSSRLAAGGGQGLELRMFQTFLRNIRGSGDPFETMDRKEDLPAAAREGRFGAVKWLFACVNGAPKDGDKRVFAEIYAKAASSGHMEILQWARQEGCD